MKAQQVFNGVWQIADDMDVCMTLLAGTERALLVDTGYGLADVAAFVRTLTRKPLTVLLTHAHHDHALGARWFDEVWLAQADFAGYAEYTGLKYRRRVQGQAEGRGLSTPEDFLSAAMPVPRILQEKTIDLGGLSAEVRLCPGHTPGSVVVYVPEHRLLLTGDNWNPCTWLFFPEAQLTQTLRENMNAVRRLPFEQVLCSHQPHLYDRRELDAFFDGVTDEALRSAQPADMGWDLDTRQIQPAENQVFVFDWNKAFLSK